MAEITDNFIQRSIQNMSYCLLPTHTSNLMLLMFYLFMCVVNRMVESTEIQYEMFNYFRQVTDRF